MKWNARTLSAASFTCMVGCQDCGNANPLEIVGRDASVDASSQAPGDGGLASLCFGSTYRCEGDVAVSCDNGTERTDCAKMGAPAMSASAV